MHRPQHDRAEISRGDVFHARKKTPGKTGPRGAKDADLSGSDWTPRDTNKRDAGAFERHPCRTNLSVVRGSRLATQAASECRPYRADIRFVPHSFGPGGDSRRSLFRTCGGRIGERPMRVKAGINDRERKSFARAGNAMNSKFARRDAHLRSRPRPAAHEHPRATPRAPRPSGRANFQQTQNPPARALRNRAQRRLSTSSSRN